jgi:hypothetical protein
MNHSKYSVRIRAPIWQSLALVAAVLFTALGGISPANAKGGVNFVMESVIRVDPAKETVTLPVFKGIHNGTPVYYVVTESSDKNDAERRKVNHAPRLLRTLGTRAVQLATEVKGVVNFAGTVAFASSRPLRAGADGIPPGTTPPSSMGDANYSPLITTGNGIVLNASHVKNGSGVHDALVSIDLTRRPTFVANAAGEVTLAAFGGFSNNTPLLYLHMDASARDVSDLEGSNFAPNLNAAPTAGSNESSISARSAIIAVMNGIETRGDPERQGLSSFLANQGDPLNVTQTYPGRFGDRYSPVWDVHIVKWTDAAIANGSRRRLVSTSDIIGEFQKGNIVDTGTGPANPSLGGIRANNAISNCPIVVDLRSVDPGQRGAAQNNSW